MERGCRTHSTSAHCDWHSDAKLHGATGWAPPGLAATGDMQAASSLQRPIINWQTVLPLGAHPDFAVATGRWQVQRHVNSKDSGGRTALHMLGRYGGRDAPGLPADTLLRHQNTLVMELMRHGAYFSALDDRHYTPFDHAISNKKFDMAR